jgi:hypothetical protein
LLADGVHTDPDDVQEGEHARSSFVDDPGFELLEILPARGACVNDCRDAAWEGVQVGINSPAPRVFDEDVSVNVNQPWRHVVTCDVHHLLGL